MLRICFLSYRGNPYSGGQGIYLKYVAEELVRQGVEVHAVVGPPFPDHMDGVVVHRIENNHYSTRKGRNIINEKNPLDILRPLNFFEYLSTRGGSFSEISTFTIRAFFLLKKLHKRFHFDIIHDNQSLGYGLLMMKSLGIPVIATIHHPLTIDLANDLERDLSFKRKTMRVMFYPLMMQKFVSKRLDHIITVSGDSKMRIHDDFGVRKEKISVVYNGIDRSIFSASKMKKKKKIIFVRNIEDGKKGFAYLLKAMTNVGEGWCLTAVDGGSVHKRITGPLIERLGISGKVTFTGKINTGELVSHYRESSIAVVPSVYEGFGFPAAEAMSCGVPVISSDGGALPEVVGDTGIIVPSRNADALSSAINRLINDEEMQNKMRKAGIERVRNFFSWERSAGKMIDIYRHHLQR